MAKKKNVRSQTGRETRQGYIGAEVEATDIQDYVIVELRYESPVAFTRSGFAAPAAAAPQADALNGVLERFDIKTLRSHFGLPAATVKSRVEIAATLPPEPDPAKFKRKGMDTDFIQSGFVQVVPKKSGDAAKLARLLKGLKCKVNTIAYNQIKALGFDAPTERDIQAFVSALKGHGVNVTHRRSKGEDIDAGCGQLRISRL